MNARLRIAGLALLLVSPALALSPSEQLPDPAQEARARDISAELRCLVCQNQSIDDSDADLAKDLRRLVRERIAAGDTNAGVKRYLVDRYGEFVLLKPVFSLRNALLWLLPFLALGIGFFASRRLFQGEFKDTSVPVAELSVEEKAELDRLTRTDA